MTDRQTHNDTRDIANAMATQIGQGREAWEIGHPTWAATTAMMAAAKPGTSPAQMARAMAMGMGEMGDDAEEAQGMMAAAMAATPARPGDQRTDADRAAEMAAASGTADADEDMDEPRPTEAEMAAHIDRHAAEAAATWREAEAAEMAPHAEMAREWTRIDG